MADRIGCTGTYDETSAYAGVRSAGTCTSGGNEVLLRVLPGAGEAYAWLDGHTTAPPDKMAGVGDGWVIAMTGKDRQAAETSDLLAERCPRWKCCCCAPPALAILRRSAGSFIRPRRHRARP